MGLFSNNKISTKKEINENEIKIYADYHKLKHPNEFKANIIKEFIGENRCLAVVDTNFVYQNSKISIEDEVKALVKLLDDLAINYRKVITKSDSNYNVLGIPIKFNNTKKVINYVIGFIITADDFDKIVGISDIFNVYHYIVQNNTDTEELLDKFFSILGDMEELNSLFSFNIYNDNFFNKMRICSGTDKTEVIEKILLKYQ